MFRDKKKKRRKIIIKKKIKSQRKIELKSDACTDNYLDSSRERERENKRGIEKEKDNVENKLK